MRLSILSIFAVVGAVVGLFLHATDLYETPSDGESEVLSFEVRRGEARSSVISRLSEEALFPKHWLLTLLVRYRGEGGCMKAGTHQLELPSSPRDILNALCEAPRAPGYRLVIREGATLWQIEAELVKAGLAKRGELLGYAGKEVDSLPSAAFLSEGVYPNRLEGYLYPDTYELPLDDTVEALVARASKRMYDVLGVLPEAGRDIPGMANTHELMTLASIVEREAVLLREMPLIASAYLNRLRQDMKLQADPTLTYTPDTWGDSATPTHRKNAKNPYNTYAHKGLPPGPIGAVSKAALLAVLQPASTGYLFFVALGDGSGAHAFSKTFDEHRKHVRNYRRMRKGKP